MRRARADRKPGHRFERVASSRVGRNSFRLEEREELYPAIRRGIQDGLSNLAIAEMLGISDRTVYRYRQRNGLPNFYGDLPARPPISIELFARIIKAEQA